MKKQTFLQVLKVNALTFNLETSSVERKLQDFSIFASLVANVLALVEDTVTRNCQ